MLTGLSEASDCWSAGYENGSQLTLMGGEVTVF